VSKKQQLMLALYLLNKKYRQLSFLTKAGTIMNKITENKIFIKLNAIMLWIMVLSASLLLFPFDLLNQYIAESINNFKITIWFSLIIAASYFISQGILLSYTTLSNKYLNKTKIERLTKAVTCLDFSERAVLREFILQRKSVLNLPITEPTIRNLISNGILSIANESLDSQGNIPVMINIDARPFITYKALGLSKGKMSEEQIEQIMNARPKYAR
jgi:hypothetical protein